MSRIFILRNFFLFVFSAILCGFSIGYVSIQTELQKSTAHTAGPDTLEIKFEKIWKAAEEKMKLGQYSQALQPMKQKLEEYRDKVQNGDPLLCKHLRKTAMMLHRSGYTEEAIQLLNAQAGLLDGKSPLEHHRMVSTLTGIYYQAGDYAGAQQYARKQLLLSSLLDDNRDEETARAHYLLGSSYWGLDVRDSVQTHYEAALHYMHGLDKYKVYTAAMYDVLGTYAFEAGQHEQAARYLSEAGLLKSDSSPSPDEYRGPVQQMLEHYRQEKALRMELLGKSNPYTVACQSNIAKTLLRTGRLEEAMEECQQVLRSFCPSFSPADFSDTRLEVSESSSLPLLFDALRIKSDILDTLSHREGMAKWITAMLQCDSVSVAALNLLRTYRRSEGNNTFWSQRAYPMFESAIGKLLNHFRQFGDSQSLERAFDYASSARAFMLNKVLRQINLMESPLVPAELAQQEFDLSTEIRGLDSFLQSCAGECNADNAARMTWCTQQLAELKLQYAELVDGMAYTYPEFHKLLFDSRQPSWHEVSRRLKKDEKVIQYFQGDSSLFVFVIDKNSLRLHEVAQAQRAKQLIEEVVKHCSERSHQNPAQLAAAAYQLYRLLFPAELLASAGSLIIIPDGALCYLPFEVLITDTGEWHSFRKLPYLFRKLPVSYAASGQMILNEGKPWRGYAGFAPDYKDYRLSAQNLRAGPEPPDLPPLPHNGKEVLRAAELIGGGQVLTGQAATEKAFRLYADRLAVLHLACHTRVDDENALRSGFYLSPADTTDDHLLSLGEIYGMQIRAQLAILSACRTSAGRHERGEGVLSLARAFSVAGAQSLISTLWICDDASTSDLVNELMTHLKSGMTKTAALRAAKLNYLNEADEVHAHPFYWSSIILWGNPSPLGTGQSMYWIWLAPATLAAGAFFWLRHRKKKHTLSFNHR